MPECDHCGSEFSGEKKYLKHLKEEHYSELSRIQKRKVDDEFGKEGEGPNLWLYVGGAISVVIFVIVLYFSIFASGGSVGGSSSGGEYPEPFGRGSVHIHGQMSVQIMGEQLDFSQSKYQLQDNYFHFESGNGQRWHVHGQDVTLGYAMDTLGIEVTKNSVTYQGETYKDSQKGVKVKVTVNGKSVNPDKYVLKRNDNVRILVQKG